MRQRRREGVIEMAPFPHSRSDLEHAYNCRIIVTLSILLVNPRTSHVRKCRTRSVKDNSTGDRSIQIRKTIPKVGRYGDGSFERRTTTQLEEKTGRSCMGKVPAAFR